MPTRPCPAATPRALPRGAACRRGARPAGRRWRLRAQPDSDAARALQDVYKGFQALLEQQQRVQEPDPAPWLHVCGVDFHPASSPTPLLTDVSLAVPPGQMGLIFGRSGAGKSTLLQIIAGLAEPTGGDIHIHPYYNTPPPTPGLTGAERGAGVGLVFQFPERHFLGRTLLQELVYGAPLRSMSPFERQALVDRVQQVCEATGLGHVGFETATHSLSDGYKRRLALAAQLVRGPGVLLLDEPLAGLDWRVRRELVELLEKLKGQCTLLVVSHDLRELAPLVDMAWEMTSEGRLRSADLAELPRGGA
ncbi:unnamed protein product [Pedinophyceae sp. YPF-701]|nr:unnamed protein product [Pedinophyceae sp. YPF-701]